MRKSRKGIILAGGSGTRLSPLTTAVSKQLLPVYNKPMIHYPLSTLMLGGIREILIITTPRDKIAFKTLLGDGSKWGITIEYEEQPQPGGLAQAFLIGEKFLNHSPATLILGDNLFYGDSLIKHMDSCMNQEIGASIFAYRVKDPERYGVVEFNNNGKVLSIKEKPQYPKSNYAITGMYYYDNSVVDRSKALLPSKRGELEITDLNMSYLKDGLLNVEIMNRGMAWLDTGTFDSLFEASSYIYTLEKRQGLKIGCPDEAAWRQNWISNEQLEYLSTENSKNEHGKYLNELLKEKN